MFYKPSKTIVLVGMMGVGKTTIGKKLHNKLDLPFVDLDAAIELDQNCTTGQIFEYAGEATFRNIEKRVLMQELDGEVKILATGGGAYLDEDSRKLIKEKAISIWLNADIGTLIDRTSKRNNRPLLEVENRAEIIKDLVAQRTPYYEQADFSVKTDVGSYTTIIEEMIEQVKNYDK